MEIKILKKSEELIDVLKGKRIMIYGAGG